MNFDAIQRIADAVLYEGYILYPYRASAVKNQHRFNFGVLLPPACINAKGTSDASRMRTECLVEGESPEIDVQIRFLQLASREVYDFAAATAEGRPDSAEMQQPVARLAVGDAIYQTWQEAVERNVTAGPLDLRDLLDSPHAVPISFAPQESSELLHDPGRGPVGRLMRRQRRIEGEILIAARAHGPRLHSVSIEIRNSTQADAASRQGDRSLLQAMASTHTLLATHSGRFVSLLDPPAEYAEAASACHNVGTWPVLAGDDQARDMMLSSPIILYDFPQIAPESGGDFCDGTEIDEMLALRVLTLTDAEKREMQSVDARARQMLERTESLPPEQWQKLHGAIRGLKAL